MTRMIKEERNLEDEHDSSHRPCAPLPVAAAAAAAAATTDASEEAEGSNLDSHNGRAASTRVDSAAVPGNCFGRDMGNDFHVNFPSPSSYDASAAADLALEGRSSSGLSILSEEMDDSISVDGNINAPTPRDSIIHDEDDHDHHECRHGARKDKGAVVGTKDASSVADGAAAMREFLPPPPPPPPARADDSEYRDDEVHGTLEGEDDGDVNRTLDASDDESPYAYEGSAGGRQKRGGGSGSSSGGKAVRIMIEGGKRASHGEEVDYDGDVNRVLEADDDYPDLRKRARHEHGRRDGDTSPRADQPGAYAVRPLHDGAEEGRFDAGTDSGSRSGSDSGSDSDSDAGVEEGVDTDANANTNAFDDDYDLGQVGDIGRGSNAADADADYDDHDGLAVAVVVSPDNDVGGDGADIPTAEAFDPEPSPPLYKNRRFRIYSIAILITLVLAAVSLGTAFKFAGRRTAASGPVASSGSSLRTSVVPTSAPTTTAWTKGVREHIDDVVGTKVYRSGTPYHKAMNWILNDDPMQLGRDSPFVVQRFLLALLYFSCDRDKNWAYCAPSDEDQTCEAVVMSRPDWERRNVTFSRMLSGASECEWYGVQCPVGDGYVREIEMVDNNLTGTLPSELAKLPYLQKLSLSTNHLEGTIPSEFGDLRHLLDIELHRNFLTGTIPESIYNADSILRLNFGENFLSGTISPNIKNMTSLVGFFTNNNKIEGSIPKEIGELEYLSALRFGFNLHTGTIPTEIGRLKNLVDLQIIWNKFSGVVPSTVGLLTKLETVYISNNLLNGTLPGEFYDMRSLVQFYGYDNFFSGTISTLVGKLSNIERFVIRRNFFTGTIPTELASLQNISVIWTQANKFTGVVSEDFCDMFEPPYQLTTFVTDCGPSDETGPPAVTCLCCTECCDTVQGTCFENT